MKAVCNDSRIPRQLYALSRQPYAATICTTAVCNNNEDACHWQWWLNEINGHSDGAEEKDADKWILVHRKDTNTKTLAKTSGM